MGKSEGNCRSISLAEINVLIFLGYLLLPPLALSETTQQQKTPIITVDDAPPLGFEDLDKPQDDLVDVFLGEKFILSTPATYTDSTLSFSQGAEIINSIPAILDREEATRLLSKTLENNINKLCKTHNQKDCGRLPSNTTGIIFNANAHRVDLFFDKTLLAVQSQTTKFIPDSNANLSFVMPFSLTASGSSNNENHYSLNGETLISKGNTHLQSLWNYSEDKGFQASDLSLRRDKKGKETRLGLFDSSGLGGGFISNQLITGARYASTTRTRTREDLSIARANRLTILLSSRSRVNIVKDGRVMSSDMYDSGNQVIDTSLLPDGSYDVVLRIQEASGQTREETRFFSKTQRLPPIDQPLYFFETGKIYSRQNKNSLPSSTDHWLVKGGYSKRIKENFGANASATITADQAIMELGSVYLHRNFQLEATAMLTNTSDYGYQVSGLTAIGPVSLNARVRAIHVDTPLEINGIDEATFRPINESSEELSANLRLPILNGQVSLSYNMRKRENESSELETEEDWSARLRYPLISNRKHRLNLVSRVQHNESSNDAFIGLEYNFSQSPRWNHNAKYGARNERRNDEVAVHTLPIQLKTTWRDKDLTKKEIEASLSLDNGVEVDQTTLGAELDYRFSGGRLRSSVDFQNSSDPNQDDFSRYSVNFNSHIAGDSKQVTWGGAQRQRAAAIIKVTSNEESSEPFNIFINRQHRGYVDTNKSTVIGLRPYENYKITVSPPAGSNFEYKADLKNLTVYPGNANTLDWKVAKTYTVYGRAFTTDGEPLKDAFIEGSMLNEGTDEYGMFQAEVTSDTKAITFNIKDGNTCTVQLTDFDTAKAIAALGELICR